APRTWGWTGSPCRPVRGYLAGPTHVGMDRTSRRSAAGTSGRPHARGDGPTYTDPPGMPEEQAPRTWGRTAHFDLHGGVLAAGPTHVGMDRWIGAQGAVMDSRPHARGDGPHKRHLCARPVGQAPRTWGWTFRGSWSVCVGVSRPHARG